MKLVRALLVLAGALALEAMLGRFWPQASRYVDVMLLPVVWYGIAGSQRSGMLVGCVAGLMQDAWFELGVLGLNGFKKTLLGWVLGGLGSRFDLNRQIGRLLAGALVSLADSLMGIGLRRLLDLEQVLPGPWEIALKALISGLMIAAAFGVAERVQRRRALRSISY